MPAGPALLAIKTSAPLITAFVSYTEQGIHIDFKQVVLPDLTNQQEMVSEIVQMTAQNFEDGVRKHPEDWHMLQRIWIDGDFQEHN
jgi:KDO2-lipid IV(A) lauroyltransferase